MFRAVGGHRSEEIKFIHVLGFIPMHLVILLQGTIDNVRASFSGIQCTLSITPYVPPPGNNHALVAVTRDSRYC